MKHNIPLYILSFLIGYTGNIYLVIIYMSIIVLYYASKTRFEDEEFKL